ncbi:MAG: hypothetical protein OEZ01_15010 [Candidatus Heimdallarchaeota archaeon]|nr:hypothetical protein [Candidatus Heimdallarchaeota archaeon]MDH5647317.1 hypothetical protein [Candidatus Heimdallarchaeota archaeon]
MLCDFYLPDFNCIIEYFGLIRLNNVIGKKYQKNAGKKINNYKKMSFNFIALLEEDIQSYETLKNKLEFLFRQK